MAEPKRKSADARLVATAGALGPREYALVLRKTTIGSAIGNRIVLDEKTVSRRHAVIRRRMRGHEVIDLGSTNGTYVNGVRVTSPVLLKRGDAVNFGKASFTFQGNSPRRRARQLGLRVAIPLTILVFLTSFALTQRWLMRDVRATLGDTRAPAAPSPVPQTTRRAARVRAAAARASAAAPIATPSGPQPEWLKRLNAYRAMAKLRPVAEDSALSAGDRAHVNYLIENLGPALRRGGNPGIDAHLESPDKPGYTTAGARAGKSSDVDFIAFGGMKLKDPVGWALVDWISGAFHRLPLLDPRLRRVGFSQICERGLCVAALDAQSGIEPGPSRVEYSAPIEFPANGTVFDLRTFTNEWPNPLSACPGYAAPTGLPITVMTGNWLDAELNSYSIERIARGGAAIKLDACGFDFSSYTNRDANSQEVARNILHGQGTVVVIPRAPLEKGAAYRVSITASGKRYQWTFSIAR